MWVCCVSFTDAINRINSSSDYREKDTATNLYFADNAETRLIVVHNTKHHITVASNLSTIVSVAHDIKFIATSTLAEQTV